MLLKISISRQKEESPFLEWLPTVYLAWQRFRAKDEPKKNVQKKQL